MAVLPLDGGTEVAFTSYGKLNRVRPPQGAKKTLWSIRFFPGSNIILDWHNLGTEAVPRPFQKSIRGILAVDAEIRVLC